MREIFPPPKNLDGRVFIKMPYAFSALVFEKIPYRNHSFEIVKTLEVSDFASRILNYAELAPMKIGRQLYP